MEIDFDKMLGLAPAVIQDADSGELLMLGFMNREALEKTLRTGLVTFYSRTRKTLWTKGETSGNRLEVMTAWADCDRDTVLLRVRVLGAGVVCHTGSRTCFTQELAVGAAAQDGELEARR
ncbi:MAG: phosphoribosyl-AMP cyclohydrolase [Candidatus Sulfotelmatobacter sp.]